MTTAHKYAELQIAAFEPGPDRRANRREYTRFVIERSMAEAEPEFLLKTANLWLHELDWTEAQSVLEFVSLVAEEPQSKLLNFASLQLTYALLAGNTIFAERIISLSESQGYGRLKVYFGDWTEYEDAHISFLQVIAGRIDFELNHDFLGACWKHLSTPGMIKVLELVHRDPFEEQVINTHRSKQDRYGGLALLISLGRVSTEVISSKVQSLIVARSLSNNLRDYGMSFSIKDYAEEASLDELDRIFTDAISIARRGEVQKLKGGLIQIVEAKTLGVESEQARSLIDRFSVDEFPARSVDLFEEPYVAPT